MHCKHWFLITAALILSVPQGWAARSAKDMKMGPVILTGLEDTQNAASQPIPRGPRRALDECATANGACDTAGFTWYDLGSNGTMNKQVAVDTIGLVHCVYTNGVNSGSSIRHVTYNVFDRSTEEFGFVGGIQIDASQRAGFAVVAARPDGFAFPAFHEVVTSGDPWGAVSIDYLPGAGAFTTVECPPLDNQHGIWPHIALDRNGDLHMVTKETAGTPNEEFYESAHPIYADDGSGLDIECDGWEPWMMTDWFITMDVAASRFTDRVAVAWISTEANPDYPDLTRRNIYLAISEDAGVNWGEPINVTGMSHVDTTCVTLGGDPMVCNGDTMEAWLDLSILMDNDDNVHIAFDGSAHYYFDTDGSWIDAGLIYSTVWHWDLNSAEFHYIDQAWYGYPDTSGVTLGVNMLMCHRGNMAIDTSDGSLYMVFQKFDTTAWSESFFGDADLWITRSNDGGRRWSVPTNLTQTSAGTLYPCGQGMHERDPSCAITVADGILYLQYYIDLDAGTSVTTTPEGCPTHNPVILSQIPVSDIPSEPLQVLYPFHADSTGFPENAVWERPATGPKEFALMQNFPNPFNPTTRIEFSVESNVPVTLAVFDLTGRLVSTLLDQQRVGAGLHTVEFDARNLASGVYLYRLVAGNEVDVRKMVLLR
jgi:hypothetical protein